MYLCIVYMYRHMLECTTVVSIIHTYVYIYI
jgi:hypothetical protein